MEKLETSTAYLNWEERWKSDAGRSEWLAPESGVKEFADAMVKSGFLRVLDLGCGVGRHALYLASAGLEVCAVDASRSGIEYARAEAEKAGLHIDFRLAPMTALPYAQESFDYVLAWNVIYHGDESVVSRAIEEIHRVLRPGGFYQGTMLSKRNVEFIDQMGETVAPNTLAGGATSDKAHPHFYCSAAELVQLFLGFELLFLADREQKKPGAYHWR